MSERRPLDRTDVLILWVGSVVIGTLCTSFLVRSINALTAVMQAILELSQ